MNEPDLPTTTQVSPNLRHNIKNQVTSLKALLELLKRNNSLNPQGKDYLSRMDSKLDSLYQSLEQYFQTMKVNENE